MGNLPFFYVLSSPSPSNLLQLLISSPSPPNGIPELVCYCCLYILSLLGLLIDCEINLDVQAPFFYVFSFASPANLLNYLFPLPPSPGSSLFSTFLCIPCCYPLSAFMLLPHSTLTVLFFLY